MPRKPVTISLPSELVKETSRFCRKRSLTLSEIARDALRAYLYKEEMESTRRAFTARMQRKGLFTEQELLKRLA